VAWRIHKFLFSDVCIPFRYRYWPEPITLKHAVELAPATCQRKQAIAAAEQQKR